MGFLKRLLKDRTGNKSSSRATATAGLATNQIGQEQVEECHTIDGKSLKTAGRDEVVELSAVSPSTSSSSGTILGSTLLSNSSRYSHGW
jgi:hypothetical protein